MTAPKREFVHAVARILLRGESVGNKRTRRGHALRCAQLGDGQMHVRIGGEAEFQRIGGLIGRQPVINEGAHIARPAGASERQFMHRRAPRFMRRVGGDGDDLDPRRMLGAPGGFWAASG